MQKTRIKRRLISVPTHRLDDRLEFWIRQRAFYRRLQIDRHDNLDCDYHVRVNRYPDYEFFWSLWGKWQPNVYFLKHHRLIYPTYRAIEEFMLEQRRMISNDPVGAWQ